MAREGFERGGRFEGKVVFISGVARGQGRQHAIRFAEEGAHIIGFDICRDLQFAPYPGATEDDLAETVKLVEQAGGALHAEVADVRDYRAVKGVAKAGIERFGRLDMILANAGSYSPMPVQFVDPESWSETIDINLTGVFHTVKAGLRQMVEQNEGGSIVITSSTAGLRGMWGSPAYNASKHGVVGLMKALALEVSANQIRVNCVHPTSVATPMIINDVFPTMVRPDLEHPTVDDSMEFLTEMQPMGIPWVEANDVTEAILWLCSNEARYVTGASLTVDGGAMLK